ncbi:MAG: glycerate kinase [Microbacterium sp.]|nr:glycerate kinase [Microbacterium sp.]MDF2562950.1 glycerate kinase [Microbacterium sp.]
MADSLRVLIAPDSFKGSMTAAEASHSIAEGWARRRPYDELALLPQADGGEGTAEALLTAHPGARWMEAGKVAGPDGRPVNGRWLRLPDGTAVVELAQMNGITLMQTLQPGIASTRGFGEVIRAALDDGAGRLVLCLGGSASNDGGSGALAALGAVLVDGDGRAIPDGADGLHALVSVDLGAACASPPGGVLVLSDVVAPLLGDAGATAVFGPQKGIGEDERQRFEAGLTRLATLLEVDATLPGMGAAGGTAFGLSALWNLRLTSGATFVSEATGLSVAAADADVLITGEGCFDGQSTTGKVVGHCVGLAEAHGLRLGIVAGSVRASVDGWAADLTELAGSVGAAMAEPQRYAVVAGSALANEMTRAIRPER